MREAIPSFVARREAPISGPSLPFEKVSGMGLGVAAIVNLARGRLRPALLEALKVAKGWSCLFNGGPLCGPSRAALTSRSTPVQGLRVVRLGTEGGRLTLSVPFAISIGRKGCPSAGSVSGRHPMHLQRRR